MPSSDNYTDPELHDQVKEEIKESDKGDAPGQWSAWKAQVTAQEYEKRGGSYTSDKENGQDESQKQGKDEDGDEEMEADNDDDDIEQGDQDYQDESEEEANKDKESGGDEDEGKQTGQKRGRGKNSDASRSNKKQKSNSGQGKQANGSEKQNGTCGSKHDKPDAPAPQGSNDRLPREGQKIS